VKKRGSGQSSASMTPNPIVFNHKGHEGGKPPVFDGRPVTTAQGNDNLSQAAVSGEKLFQRQ
jgi:hypothetical protein